MADNDKPKCGGRLSKGREGTCTQPAGWGTDHPGIGACKLHGGSTPNHQKHAQVEQARRDVELFAARRDIHPAEALLELVQWTAGEVDYWRSRVRELEENDLTWGVTKAKHGGDDGGVTEEAKPNIAYVMLISASDRLKSYSEAALKAGVDAALVRIAESQGVKFYEAIQQIDAARHRWLQNILAAAIEAGSSLEDVRDEIERLWTAHSAEAVPPILRAIGGGDPA